MEEQINISCHEYGHITHQKMILNYLEMTFRIHLSQTKKGRTNSNCFQEEAAVEDII